MLVCGAEAGNAPSGGAYGRTDSSSPVPGAVVSWPSSCAFSSPATPQRSSCKLKKQGQLLGVGGSSACRAVCKYSVSSGMHLR